MTSLVVCMAFVSGWVLLAWRIANAIDSHLHDPSDAELALLDEIFRAVAPWPFLGWIDRVAKRRLAKDNER